MPNDEAQVFAADELYVPIPQQFYLFLAICDFFHIRRGWFQAFCQLIDLLNIS